MGCAKTEVKVLELRQGLQQIHETGNEVGKTPPDFSVVDTEGNTINLSRAIAEKPVIVYFLATWCPYCAQDFTQLSKAYSNYSGEVEIIAISLDLSEDSQTLKEYKSRYPQLLKVHFAPGKEHILKDYSVTRTTTKYAIKNQTVIYSSSGVFNENYWTILLKELAK